ncbi:hypothetical protein FB384_004958 [Prauserella sediminis]|uniref:Uncharacterized protein n=1 Tax=Prauserella sediminis TaxID=577680 RepID=A0A839XVB2_9PSEU|nr:hypothetical protein [Prauserella sediminis]MBB3665999.1 hypothetical protein [Prauserella sediminis]
MACKNCGGKKSGASRPPAMTGAATAQTSADGPTYRVVLANGATITARSHWDAVQKQAMYGGAIEEVK